MDVETLSKGTNDGYLERPRVAVDHGRYLGKVALHQCHAIRIGAQPLCAERQCARIAVEPQQPRLGRSLQNARSVPTCAHGAVHIATRRGQVETHYHGLK